MQAISGGFVMFGIATTTGQGVPLLLALAFWAYAALFPLQLGAAVVSRAFVRWVARLALYATALASAAYELSLFVNSGLGPLSMLGSVMFILLVAGTGVIVLRTVILRAIRSVPPVASASGRALSSLRLQAEWISIYVRNR